jgi:[ribosomal protein S18]-alanine N-acetyltransferase
MRSIYLAGLPYQLMPMAPEHVPTVSAIEVAVFTHPWSKASFLHEVRSNPDAEYWVLRYLPWMSNPPPTNHGLLGGLRRTRRDDPSILGYGGAWLVLDEAHVCTLAVRPGWRGRGLGELLLSNLLERGRARGARVATLEVRASNHVAQALYRKYGFADVGTRRGYYQDNLEDAHIMSTGPIDTPEYARRYAALGQQLRERLLRLVPSEDELLALRAG